MKKILLLVIVIMQAIHMCSCLGSLDVPPSNMSEARFVYSAKWFGRLICYDLDEMRATVACPDPLCEHGDDCPVSGIIWYCVDDDFIVFSKYLTQTDGDYTALYYYDLKKGVIDTIKTGPRIGMTTIVDDYIFFSATYMEYDENGMPLKDIWEIFRYDTTTAKLMKLNTKSIADSHYVYTYTEDLLYWSGGNGSYYSTNYDYGNIQSVDPSMGIRKGNSLITLQPDYSDPYSSFSWIISKKQENGEVEQVLSGVYSFGDDNPASPKGMIFNSYHHNNGNTIFYMDYENFETRKLCDLPEGVAAFDLYTEQGSKRCLGDYVGIYVHSDGMTYQETTLSSESMMFIDINTGDYFILTP